MAVSLDCADPTALAEFWSELLDGQIVMRKDEVVAVKIERMLLVMIQVPDHRPPSWPGNEVPKQIHLELDVQDLDAAEAEALRLGARRADTQPGPDKWRVFFDPAGHPFCFTTQIPRAALE
ncbi:VOC family protein [Amycolatopsis anabasis]|uniref:VOC family protein n=1 Tax=Amycolatopsis anabasis TaxID=1840409 RepID=UPI001FE96DC8|nr:VOC family protein [Amycolatopsis anabasis]